jgi:hypothetical protein
MKHKLTYTCAVLVMAMGVVTVPSASAASERLTYHCNQVLATNIEPVGVKQTGVDGQVIHITQHGTAEFNCPGLGAGTTEIWLHGNLNPQFVGMLQGTTTMTFTGGVGGFDVTFVGHGDVVFIATPPFLVLTWTGKPVGHGFGTYDGWQLRGTEQRDLYGITYDLVLFQPGE